MCLMNELEQLLRRELPQLRLLSQEPLAAHTSFRIGGPARLMAFPEEEAQLARILQLTSCRGFRCRVLGAGTNVLCPDEGLDCLVLCLKDSLTGLRITEDGCMEAYAGESLARTAVFAREHGLTGLEFAHGIPGSVGGGIYMNAGAYGSELSGVTQSVSYLTMDGQLHTASGEALQFGYRTSLFEKVPSVVIKAVFRLSPGDPEAIQARMRELLEKRRASQPLELPSAGSVFKRPQGYFAGALIEAAGLKGKGVGGAEVSQKHAGFIVNRGGATAQDVLDTVRLVQKTVLEQSGVLLEPEVRLWGQEESPCDLPDGMNSAGK